MKTSKFVARSRNQPLIYIKDSADIDDTHLRRGNLSSFSKTYLAEADRYVQHWPVMARVLEKPNCHRLSELWVNDITCSEYCLASSEHVVEMVHCVFKIWIYKNQSQFTPLCYGSRSISPLDVPN